MKKDITFVDLFAGAGGFGLGFIMEGYKPILSLEIDESASQTLKSNSSHFILNKNIIHFNSETKILNLFKDKPDVIIGGPPCQGFSQAASNRIKKNDSRNDMFKHYLFWVSTLSPKVFVIENVPGILTKKNNNGEKIFEEIESLSNKIGYNLTIWKLNAADFGTPQSRNRVFIIGTKENLYLPLPTQTHFPGINIPKNKLPHVTVAEAILDLPIIQAGEGEETMEYSMYNNLSNFQLWARKKNEKVFNHVAMKHTNRVVERYKLLINGEKELPDELKVRKRSGGGILSDAIFNLNYRYLDPNLICPTVPASFYSSFIHPVMPRNITTREAARIQSFPDSYKFLGSRTLISDSLLKRQGKESLIGLSQYNQVGNAVPPLLARAVAKAIKSLLS